MFFCGVTCFSHLSNAQSNVTLENGRVLMTMYTSKINLTRQFSAHDEEKYTT